MGDFRSFAVRPCMTGALRWLLMVCVFGAVSAQAASTCTGGALPAGSGDDLQVTGACTVGAGTYRYGNVNVYAGGSLTFQDTVIDFWARNILIEAGSSLIAGSATAPIGTAGGALSFHLYGAVRA